MRRGRREKTVDAISHSHKNWQPTANQQSKTNRVVRETVQASDEPLVVFAIGCCGATEEEDVLVHRWVSVPGCNDQKPGGLRVAKHAAVEETRGEESAAASELEAREHNECGGRGGKEAG